MSSATTACVCLKMCGKKLCLCFCSQMMRQPRRTRRTISWKGGFVRVLSGTSLSLRYVIHLSLNQLVRLIGEVILSHRKNILCENSCSNIILHSSWSFSSDGAENMACKYIIVSGHSYSVPYFVILWFVQVPVGMICESSLKNRKKSPTLHGSFTTRVETVPAGEASPGVISHSNVSANGCWCSQWSNIYLPLLGF